MEPKDLAWCAGLFEGEGNLHLSTQYDLQITVVNTNRELLEPFTIFGGSLTIRSKAKDNWKQVYQWRIGGNDIGKEFINSILPYITSSGYKLRFSWALQFIDFDKAQPRYMSDRDISKYELFRTKINANTQDGGK